MPGWSTNGEPAIGTFSGFEEFPVDTYKSGGQAPQTGAVSLVALATAAALFSNFASKTTVSGTRYYTQFQIGYQTLLTGIQVLVGSVGGTDNWIFELHDVNGVLLATTATAGTTAGTAGTWQQIAFTAAYTAQPGTYYLVVQSNGTTAHPAVYNFPAPAVGTAVVTGSATGVFGTGANFTPATTYTANVGPVALPY